MPGHIYLGTLVLKKKFTKLLQRLLSDNLKKENDYIEMPLSDN